MKKLSLLFMIFAVLCFVGCDTQQSQPTVQTTVPEPTHCKHETLSEAPSLVYLGPDYGGSCEDPMRVYHKCLECGEDVFVKEKSTGVVCTEMSYSKVVTKQPTCTEEGTYTFECFHCKKVRERSIPSKGHKFSCFWGEDVPRCLDCRIVQENACNHEYVKGYERNHNEVYPGIRFHVCRKCNAETFEIFDEKGNYDLRMVKDALSARLQSLGFQVLEEYNRSLGKTMYEKAYKFDLKNTNSKDASQQLIEHGHGLIDLHMSSEMFHEAGVDLSLYYAWVDIKYVVDDIFCGLMLHVNITNG